MAKQRLQEEGTMATYSPDLPEQKESLEEMISGLIQEVNFLREEVDRQSSLTPKWMTSEEMDGFEQRQTLEYDPQNIMANLRGDKDEGQAGQLYFGTDSHPIPPNLLRRYGPKFQLNQKVQVNPDAIQHGTQSPWSAALGLAQSSGRGVIKKVIHLTDSGEWKYQVRVPGLTNRHGSGFLESELLPIKQKVTRYVTEE